MIVELNTRLERIVAFCIFFCFALTLIPLYSNGFQLFVMFVSFQLAIALLGCEIEYIVLWRTTDDEKKGWRTLRNYMILFIMVFLVLIPGVLEFIAGIDTLVDLLNPLFFAWYVIIGWFLGKVIARQTYILRPPSEIKEFLRGLKEDRNTT